MTVALSDGTVAKTGGKVIKNVAGYDLAKLFAGSLGTLGAIVEVAVRLHPLPPATATAVGRHRATPRCWPRRAAALTHAPLEHAGLDVRWEAGAGLGAGPLRRRRAAARRPRRPLASCARRGSTTELVEDDDALWAAQRDGQRARPGEPDTVVRVAGAADRPAGAAGRRRAPLGRCWWAAPALGLSWLRLRGPRRGAGRARATLRRSRAARRGAGRTRRGARAGGRRGAPRDAAALALMRRVKERFDPAGVAPPGCSCERLRRRPARRRST